MITTSGPTVGTAYLTGKGLADVIDVGSPDHFSVRARNGKGSYFQHRDNIQWRSRPTPKENIVSPETRKILTEIAEVTAEADALTEEIREHVAERAAVFA